MATIHDDELAAHIAEKAGRALLELRYTMGLDDPKALGAEGDRRSNEVIMAVLGEARPDDAVLSEEGDDGSGRPERAGAARVWIIDPLDGTREYSEGRDDFAVHVGLAVDGRPMVGAVALPGEDLVLVTGARRSRERSLAPRPDGPMRIVVSRTRPPVEAERVAARLGAELVPMGSAGAKTAAVLRGSVDAYVHSGGQYEWDSAAPVAVAHAYGAFATRLDGSVLLYNQPDPWLPDLLVCRPELSGDILDALVP
ncbi:MAG TPA: 3'(2'),5'-bisphosphate nucleotidase CysQ [Acidimicrobiales bacterium]|nr:3'(2'),5'-bisphosphate nucleotidase CysQ [Acidimicrobiales bacterium]